MKKVFTSIRVKLFLSLCVIVLLIVTLSILLNNFVLEKYYVYNKKEGLKKVYSLVNDYYNQNYEQDYINSQLEKISIKNDFDILIKNDSDENIYFSNKDFFSSILEFTIMSSRDFRNRDNLILEQEQNFMISEANDTGTNIRYIMITAKLDNGYKSYIRMPMNSIQESVKISNKFLYIIAIFVLLFGTFVINIVSKRFSKPIQELETIAKKMSNLDFSQKYKCSATNDEIDELGKSINVLSDKLERTIKQLKRTNFELEKDVEEKSQIDEMRKSFISDVSHELKTPIALIQGYSEGLLENVNTDEESKHFYAEVILDEATKMDKLVKRLLELMKLEYGKMKFNNSEFNIVELEKEILRKSQVMIEKENINVDFEQCENINIYADDFYIEQVLTNYIMNAIKYSTEINGEKRIKIKNEINTKTNKLRVKIFNTFNGLSEEEMTRIWNRFYKLDESRNRSKGGNGIGLSLVKAIMNNYGNKYGVKNVAGGVEFYFEVELAKQ